MFSVEKKCTQVKFMKELFSSNKKKDAKNN